ncbi:MAG: hypothetical protein LQ340_000979 [Diploschistes diacapsis]|nr:MAG: hypothetical protein LQ340_000979 [Diploschistes diacapsis]
MLSVFRETAGEIAKDMQLSPSRPPPSWAFGPTFPQFHWEATPTYPKFGQPFQLQPNTDIPPTPNHPNSNSSKVSSDLMSWATDAELPSHRFFKNAEHRSPAQTPLRRPYGSSLRSRNAGNGLRSATHAPEPVSSGFNSPKDQDPQNVTNCIRPATPPQEAFGSCFDLPKRPGQPNIQHDLLGRDLGYDDGPDDEDMHSTHNVPLIFPMVKPNVDRQQKQAHVKAWLAQVPCLSPSSTSCKGNVRSPTERTDSPESLTGEFSKNKENIPPNIGKRPAGPAGKAYRAISGGSAGTIPDLLRSGTPMQPLAERQIVLPRSRPQHLGQHSSPSAGSSAVVGTDAGRPHMARGLSSLPLRRKRPSSKLTENERGASSRANRMVTPVDASKEEKLAALSPSVTRFRKGKGPKTGHCPSYSDDDILPERLRRKEKKK